MQPWNPNLEGHEALIQELVLETPSPGKQAARSAIRHCERALKTKEVDAEMAVFRALTAEEEAARAIFHSLQRHKYPHARLLNWQNHLHKNAVVPFCSAVGRALGTLSTLSPKAAFLDSPPRLRIQISVQRADGAVEQVYPHPPLHGLLAVGTEDPGFHSELERIAGEADEKSPEGYLKCIANLRNTILYASDRGVPRIANDVGPQLQRLRKNVFSLLALYVLIDQHKQHQSLVVAALNSFVRIVPGLQGRLDKDADHAG